MKRLLIAAFLVASPQIAYAQGYLQPAERQYLSQQVSVLGRLLEEHSTGDQVTLTEAEHWRLGDRRMVQDVSALIDRFIDTSEVPADAVAQLRRIQQGIRRQTECSLWLVSLPWDAQIPGTEELEPMGWWYRVPLAELLWEDFGNALKMRREGGARFEGPLGPVDERELTIDFVNVGARRQTNDALLAARRVCRTERARALAARDAAYSLANTTRQIDLLLAQRGGKSYVADAIREWGGSNAAQRRAVAAARASIPGIAILGSDACTVWLEDRTTFGDRSHEIKLVRIPLGEIDYVSVSEDEPEWVHVAATRSDAFVTIYDWQRATNPATQRSWTVRTFRGRGQNIKLIDRSDATRIANALRHGAALCSRVPERSPFGYGAASAAASQHGR